MFARHPPLKFRSSALGGSAVRVKAKELRKPADADRGADPRNRGKLGSAADVSMLRETWIVDRKEAVASRQKRSFPDALNSVCEFNSGASKLLSMAPDVAV
jgi:hypothetical protein